VFIAPKSYYTGLYNSRPLHQWTPFFVLNIIFKTTKWLIFLVRPAGFEPATYGLEVIYSFFITTTASATGCVFIQSVNFFSS